MRSLLNNRLAAGVTGLVALGAASTAFALPWDLDLVDQQNIKPFEQAMRQLPDGAVPQPNILTPRIGGYFDIASAPTITDFPAPSTTASVAQGEELYRIYCSMCHGYGNERGPVMQSGRFPDAIIGRTPTHNTINVWPMGLTYKAIRYGKLGPDGVTSSMPSYGWAMTETEIWSVIHYLKQASNPPTDGGAQ